MSEFHPLHVKSRNVRLRKIKTQWRTNTKIKRIRFICFTQTSSFAYHSTWPSTLLSVKTEELAIRQKAKFLPGYVRRIYFRDVLRFHIMLLYIYSSFLNVKFLHARSASVHATPYVLNTKLRDAYLNLSFLLQLITWSVPHFIAHLMYKENDLFFLVGKYFLEERQLRLILFQSWSQNYIRYNVTIFAPFISKVSIALLIYRQSRARYNYREWGAFNNDGKCKHLMPVSVRRDASTSTRSVEKWAIYIFHKKKIATTETYRAISPR